MNRKTQTIAQRNRDIRAEFAVLYRSRLPVMHIYSQLAAKYDLSEGRIREIVKT